ncbi:hypothetical protein TKK_0011135 [Trichogramma kaykai]
MFQIDLSGSIIQQQQLAELHRLRKTIIWGTETKRPQLFCRFNKLFSNWKGQLPNLRNIFTKEEIEGLLIDSIKDVHKSRNSYEGIYFVNFVMQSGYKDEPDVDKNGKPLLRRNTALHYATRLMFDKVLVSKLFQIYNKFDVNYTDMLGLTHFHVACEYGFGDIVEKFLDHGQDPNCLVTLTGDSPLHVAVFRLWSNIGLAQLLLRRGADPTLINARGETPLDIICMGDCDDDVLAKMLFEIADEKHQLVKVDELLQSAVVNELFYVTKLLLRRGANPNTYDKDRMNWTVSRIFENFFDDDLMEIITVMIDEQLRAIPIDTQGRWGQRDTLLHLAVRNDKKKAAELLLRRGANPNLVNLFGSTPLHIICRTHRNGSFLELFFNIIEDIRQTVQLDARDHWGNTPLHLICKGKINNDVAKTFFKICDEKHLQVEVNAVDKLGRTPLHWAVASLLSDAVDLLLNHGADISCFVFPTEDYYGARFNPEINYFYKNKLIIASEALATLDSLENRGYELDQSSALTVMKFFAKHGLLETSPGLEERWYDEEEFATETKVIMIKPDLSLYDLVQLQPVEAAKLITRKEYSELARSVPLWDRIEQMRHQRACVLHLLEKMSRGFFRDWAIESFMELTKCRLPLECSEIIMDKSLTNKDLYNFCLAAAGPSISDGNSNSDNNSVNSSDII